MLEYCKMWWGRILGAWIVLKGDAIPIPIFDEDTTVIVLETEGSKVSFVSCRSFVETEQSYNILISKIVLWVCSKGRFFWTGDLLGSQLKDAAEEYFEEHKNRS